MRQWSLSDVALTRPVTVGMVLVAVLLLGIIGVGQMPLSFLPTMQEPRMSIRVDITRTSPEVLERDVVRPIEEEIAGIRDLSRIQVGSGSWGVRINLDFEPGTDIDARKIEVRDRIERVRGDLPDFVQAVKLSSYTNNDDPVMEMRVASGTDLSEDYYLIEERVVRPIERIPGVARVELDGVDPHELEVAVDLEATARTGVSLDELGSAVRDSRQGQSLGVLRGPHATHGVRTPAGAADPDVLGEVPLRRAARAPPVEVEEGADEEQQISFARLREVADVGTHPEDRRRGKRLNGRRAINLEVFASSGASIVDVTTEIRAAIAEMGNDPALDGIELLVFEDQGESILQTLGDLRDTGLYGGLLGIVVLFLFLRRISTTAAASISIPLSVMAACAVLFVRGDELNCIVMLGLVIAIGMLIDNAVVIVESIAQQLQKGVPRLEAARRGAREVGFATIASTMSTVIVFLPLLVDDPSNKASAYLRPLGVTFAIGLIASLLVSQTAIPLLMGRVIRVRTRPQRRPVLGRGRPRLRMVDREDAPLPSRGRLARPGPGRVGVRALHEHEHQARRSRRPDAVAPDPAPDRGQQVLRVGGAHDHRARGRSVRHPRPDGHRLGLVRLLGSLGQLSRVPARDLRERGRSRGVHRPGEDGAPRADRGDLSPRRTGRALAR